MAETAIVLFGFNRPHHMERALRTLSKNREFSSLPVLAFVDGPRHERDKPLIAGVTDTVTKARPDAIVKCRHKNLGVAESITLGVTEALEKYEQVIVIEDDLELAPHFLRYMLAGLDFYRAEEKVASVHGYTIPMRGLSQSTYFLRGTDCWGWGTWRRAWRLYRKDSNALLNELISHSLESDFTFGNSSPHLELLEAVNKNQIDSWAIRWHASVFLSGGLTLHPSVSLVRNAGMDGSGRHSGNTTLYESLVSVEPVPVEEVPVEESKEAFLRYRQFYRKRKRLKRLSRARREVSVKVRKVLKKLHKGRS